jgi:hypothetical protein
MELAVQHGDSNGYSLSDAASIIKTIDSASDEARQSAISASREVEEARKNARAASEVAKKFMALAGSSSFTIDTDRSLLPPESFDIRNGSPHSTPQKKQRIPSSPLSNLNGRSPDRSWSSRRGSPVSTSHTSSSERVARANADAVVSLTLELDRYKHHLEAEQMAHDETRSALAQAKARNVHLEAQIEKLLNNMETQRENFGRKISLLQQDVSTAQMRVAAAEEDAQMALDLAKQNNDSRVEVEAVLEQALRQSETLQMELQSKNMLIQSLTTNATTAPRPPPPPPPMSTPDLESHDAHVRSSAKAVRFADSPAASIEIHSEATPSKVGSRADVSLGRQLLQRALNGGSPSPSLATTADAPSDLDRGYHASVERSQRLQETLKKNYLEVDIKTPSSVASSVTATPKDDGRNEPHFSQPSNNAAVFQNVSAVLKASGKRLNLTGRLWNDKETSVSRNIKELETLARHYCTSVEVKFWAMDDNPIVCLLHSYHILLFFRC